MADSFLQVDEEPEDVVQVDEEPPAPAHAPYANLDPQSAGAEEALAQARKKLPQPKPVEAPSPGLIEGGLRSYVGGALAAGNDEGMGWLAEKLGKQGARGLGAEPGKALRMPDGSTRMLSSPQDVYKAVRDFERQSGKKFSEAHPYADFILSSAGNMTADYALAGKKALGPLWNAVQGAAQGFLGSDAELTDGSRDAGEVAKAGLATGLGGVAGAVLPVAIPAVAKKAVGAGRALKDFAEERAVKVLGRDLNGVLNAGKERVHELGRDLLDNVLRPGMSSKGAGKELEKVVARRGEHLGGLMDMIDDAAQPGDKLRVEDLAWKLKQALTSGQAPAEKGIRDTIAGEIGRIRDLAKPIGKRFVGGEAAGPVVPDTATLGVRQAEELLKRPAQEAVNYEARRLGPNQEALKRLASGIRQGVEDNADDIVAKRLPDVAGEFQAAKKAYGLAKQALDVTGEQARRDLKNNLVTPTDYAAGMAGASSAREVPATAQAAAWALANHILKGRGDSVAAVAADRVGDLANKLQVLPRVVQRVGAPLAEYAIRYVLREHPEAVEALLNAKQPDAPSPPVR